jgi:hypothetical protein
MYDTLILSLNVEAAKVDFLTETSQHFEVTGEHLFSGMPVISGTLGNLKVTSNTRRLKVDGSLCKWFLGDNLQTLGRGDAKRAIEKLSDTLHLPMSQADLTRLDIAQNFIVKYEPNVYYNHLGSLQYYNRFMQTDSLYYQNGKRQLVFYDKNKEQRAKRGNIPEVYTGRQVLRYEMRFKSRLREQFIKPEVKAQMLYDEPFYIDITNRWLNEYKAIQKLNTISLNFEAMKTKRELYIVGLASLVDKAGGELAFIQQINEAYQTGRLTKKQAFDMRQAVKDACKADFATIESDVIQELNEKVKQAARFYR